MKYIYYNCSEIEDLCYRLARKIKRSGFRFDVIIGICRGGWIPARYLADLLDDVKCMASIKTEFYSGIGKTKQFRITQPVSTNVNKKVVLLVDDVADSGITLRETVKHLMKKGAKVVKTACLHYKPRSLFKPDFYIRKTDAWIVYPWTEKEIVNLLKERPDLWKIGIPKEKIERLISL